MNTNEKIKALMDTLTPEKLDKMSVEERHKLNQLVNELKERKLKYPILDFEPQQYQKDFLDAV
jgi:hypothetical protein